MSVTITGAQVYIDGVTKNARVAKPQYTYSVSPSDPGPPLYDSFSTILNGWKKRPMDGRYDPTDANRKPWKYNEFIKSVSPELPSVLVAMRFARFRFKWQTDHGVDQGGGSHNMRPYSSSLGYPVQGNPDYATLYYNANPDTSDPTGRLGKQGPNTWSYGYYARWYSPQPAAIKLGTIPGSERPFWVYYSTLTLVDTTTYPDTGPIIPFVNNAIYDIEIYLVKGGTT